MIMFSRVSLQRSRWHVLSSVTESKAAPTQSSCPSGTDRFFLRHSWHFVPGYSHASLRDNKSPGDRLRRCCQAKDRCGFSTEDNPGTNAPGDGVCGPGASFLLQPFFSLDAPRSSEVTPQV